EVGSINHDRLTAIAGRIGGVAPMVPVHVRVEKTLRATEKDSTGSDANVEIVKDPVWLPMLVEMAIASSAQARISYEAGGTVDLVTAIAVADRTLEIKDTYSAEPPMRVSAFVARDIGNLVAVLSHQNILPVEVKSVHIELKLSPVVQLSILEQVVPDRTVVRP